MTTTTGTQRPSGSREGSFDALISPEKAAVGASRTGFDRTGEVDAFLLDEAKGARPPFGWITVIVIVAVALIAITVTALLTPPQQAAGAAAPAEAPTDVTAASIAALVEQGWTEAGGSGSVTCAEPVSQAPGTAIDCTALYGSTPLLFTAVIGDPALDEPQILIASWSEAASG